MGQLNMREAENIKSIGQALSILNEAAKDSSDEIKRMVNKDYRRIKETLSDVRPEITSALRDIREASSDSILKAKEKIAKSAREAVDRVDQEAHRAPWVFIGGAAAIAAILGFAIGRKTKQA